MSIDVQEEIKYIDMHFNVVREIDSLKRILNVYYDYKMAYNKDIDISVVIPFLDDLIGDEYAFLVEMMERRNTGQTFYITDKLKIKLSKVLDEIALIDLTILEKESLLRECLEKIKETYFDKNSNKIVETLKKSDKNFNDMPYIMKTNLVSILKNKKSAMEILS